MAIEADQPQNDQPCNTGAIKPGVARLRDDPDAKATFLTTFTADEAKVILRKMDRKFLVVIGLMYMIRQVPMPTLLVVDMGICNRLC